MKRIISTLLAVILVLGSVFAFASCGQDDELIGFDIDLAKAVGEELDIKVTFVEINWDTKEADLETKNIDLVWNGFTYTTDRDNGYTDPERGQIGGLAFTGMYMKNKQVAVVKKDATYTDNASMAGATFVAEASSAGESVIKDVFSATANQVEKQLDALVGVQAGTYDVAVLDASLASQYVTSENGAYHDSLKVIDITGVAEEFYSIGAREGSNLVDVVNIVLAKLYAEGVAEDIAKEYGLEGVLYNGFEDVDANAEYPTDGDWKYVKDKGEIVIGYTIFAPMAYMAE